MVVCARAQAHVRLEAIPGGYAYEILGYCDGSCEEVWLGHRPAHVPLSELTLEAIDRFDETGVTVSGFCVTLAECADGDSSALIVNMDALMWLLGL